MKKLIGYALSAMLLATSCTATARTSQSSYVDIPQSFTELEVSTIIDVEYTVGNSVSCKFSADEYLARDLKFEVRHGVLAIYVDKEEIFDTNNRRVKVWLTAPAVRDIDVSGKSTVVCTGEIDVLDLEVSVSGVSGVEIPTAKGSDVDIEVSGASSVKIGTITGHDVTLETSGTSHIKVNSLSATELETSSSGASGISVGNIDAKSVESESSGSSHVELAGRTVSVDLSCSGASSISAENLSAHSGQADASGTSHISCNVAQLDSSTSGLAKISNK